MKKTGNVLYRRSPHLVMYWQGSQLIFENYADRTRISAAPITFEILKFFDRWRPGEALFRRMDEFSQSSVREAITTLVHHSLLQRSDQARPAIHDAMQT